MDFTPNEDHEAIIAAVDLVCAQLRRRLLVGL